MSSMFSFYMIGVGNFGILHSQILTNLKMETLGLLLEA